MCMDGVVSGLFSSNETVVDPWLLAMSNLHGALESGRCQLRLGCEVLSLKRAESRTGVDTLWEVETRLDLVVLVLTCSYKRPHVQVREGSLPSG